MAAYFTLTLDTTAPSGCGIKIATPTNVRSVTATLSATGATQMKLWGGIVSGSSATEITESGATWESYAATKALTLSTGDGTKTVYAKFRDAVGNESVTVSATVTLDTTAPVVTVTGPDVSTISLVSGYNESAFSFTVSEAFVAYEVRVVTSNTSAHSVGTVIGTANGSVNMSGTGSWEKTSAISCVINGADLAAASSGDGAKIIKVFVKDSSGNWSV